MVLAGPRSGGPALSRRGADGDAEPTPANVRCVEGVDLGALRIEKFSGRRWEPRPGAGP